VRLLLLHIRELRIARAPLSATLCSGGFQRIDITSEVPKLWYENLVEHYTGISGTPGQMNVDWGDTVAQRVSLQYRNSGKA
jgi:hypothetical protein